MRTDEIELAEDVIERRWLDVEESIRLNRPFLISPWAALPGEPRLAQLAFYSYRDSAQRDLAVTTATMALRYSDVKDLARLYEWQRRAEMYDIWVDRQGDAARAELIAKTAHDTAAAFSRLPALSASAFQLVESAVNEKLKQQAERVKSGRVFSNLDDEDDDDEASRPISISQAIRIAETTRALLDATTRFLGVKVNVEHTVSGQVDHVHTVSDTDALKFLQGLSEAGYDVGMHPDAIEVGDGR